MSWRDWSSDVCSSDLVPCWCFASRWLGRCSSATRLGAATSPKSTLLLPPAGSVAAPRRRASVLPPRLSQPDCTQINPTTHKSTRLPTNQPDCTQINPTAHKSTRQHTNQPDDTQINPTLSTLHINPARCVMASWSSKATLPPHKAPHFPCPPLGLRPNGAKPLPPLRSRWSLPGGVAYVPEFINPANQPYCTQINPTQSTLHISPTVLVGLSVPSSPAVRFA